MKTTKDPMLTLSDIFKRNNFTILPPKKGKLRADILVENNHYKITFTLPKLVKGQKFLGLYPVAATLPNADNLTVGDYALLGNGEVIQIGKD